MRYKIDHSNVVIDEAKNKQELYFKWEDLMRSHREKGSFDWTSGFIMKLRDHTEIICYDKQGKIPKYDQNEWKNR